MTLYRKIAGTFTPVSDAEEATIRDAIVADGSSGPLLFNDSGFECVHSDEEAAAVRAEWAAALEARAAFVPRTVLRRQFLIALRRMGLRAAVDAAVANAGGETQDTYDNALNFERDHPMLLAMAQSLGVTSEQLDDLFRLAATL